MIPWMWKSGMTVNERSAAVRCSDVAMFWAEAARFRWRSGTIFGRDVVPDVWSTSASSSAVSRAGWAAAALCGGVDEPRAAPVTTSRSTDRPPPLSPTIDVSAGGGRRGRRRRPSR